MKVYYVYPDDYNYDEYTGLVIVAENERDALAMTKTGGHEGGSYFYKWQGEIHVEEVDLNKAHIVMESYNAG